MVADSCPPLVKTAAAATEQCRRMAFPSPMGNQPFSAAECRLNGGERSACMLGRAGERRRPGPMHGTDDGPQASPNRPGGVLCARSAFRRELADSSGDACLIQKEDPECDKDGQGKPPRATSTTVRDRATSAVRWAWRCRRACCAPYTSPGRATTRSAPERPT